MTTAWKCPKCAFAVYEYWISKCGICGAGRPMKQSDYLMSTRVYSPQVDDYHTRPTLVGTYSTERSDGQ